MIKELQILLVEDNLPDVDLIREMLPETGSIRFRIESVSRLSEALTRLNNAGIDLILLDLGLPDSQGLETLHKIRNAAPNIPIIVLTGNDNEELALSALRADAQDYLIKGQIRKTLLVRATRYALERKQAENRQRLTRDILDILNRSQDSMSTVTKIMRLIKMSADFEAIGIRLREHEDFPYYTANGFSEDFLAKERYLCARDETGNIVRDGKKKPILECMCGNILCSRTDPTLPFFTPGGSFWTNSTTDLLASTVDEQRPSRTRNRCNEEGYESVALIPLRSGDEIIGLLQINDRRPNRFTLETIVYLEGLGTSIGIALSRQKMEEALHESEEKYRELVQNANSIILKWNRNGEITFLNEYGQSFFGFTEQEILGKKIIGTIANEFEETGRNLLDMFDDMALYPEKYINNINQNTCKDGTTVWISWTNKAIQDKNGHMVEMFCIGQDVTERIKAVEALYQSEERYRQFFEQDLTGDLITSVDGKVLDCNPAYLNIFGLQSKEEALQINVENHYSNPKDRADFLRLLQKKKKLLNMEKELRRKDGKPIYTIENNFGIFNDRDELIGVRSYIFDNTERKLLEEQFRQAQKMESVGRLAGGIAHDFNNIIMAIRGYSDLVLRGLPQDDILRKDVQEIGKAADRAALLTRQLLAFARKETVKPVVLDLNDTVSGILKMIQRLVGEDISLTWTPGPNLNRIKIDPSQIDQILVNLAVNARDAVQGVGRIAIETTNVEFDTEYCSNHLGFIPGEYVLLTISDDGCGMNKETLAKIFDPFFTTKEQGKGTGLGLAAVFGAVKQNDGFINVYSEPGQGTTFRIYLPRFTTGEVIHIPVENGKKTLLRGTETVLLIEDDATILNIGKRMLVELGYTVLTANQPKEAIRLVRETSSVIDLVITDVVMPEMNGHELSQRLLAIKPDMKCIYMSGYTADVIAHHGIVEEGIRFIQKPFSANDLAIQVRKALDE